MRVFCRNTCRAFFKTGRAGKITAYPVCADRALLSTVSFNEGKTVPGIAHGVVIEHAD